MLTQPPAEQVWFEPHVRLHEPQFAESLLVSTQMPLQLVKPGAQPLMQLPWLQNVPLPQTLPQLPQLPLSEEGSVQALLQNNCPLGQAQLAWLQV